MQRKNILMISYHTCPLASEEGKETGGMNVYVLELAKSLALKDHRIDVITRSQGEDNEKIVTVSPGFRVIHLKAGAAQPLPKKKLIELIPEFVDSFSRFLKEEKCHYDLIHAHYYQSGIAALEINKKRAQKLPLVMIFHTLALMKNLVARSAAEFETQERIAAEFELVEKADAIITPSESDRQYLKYLYNAESNRVHEIPPGVNTKFFKPIKRSEARNHIQQSDKAHIILFVGRIEPLKGIDALLYALKVLTVSHPEVPYKLLIVGGDVSQHVHNWSPQLQQLEALSRTLGVAKSVTFIGQKPQHQLPFYYNSADVLVMPSHYESFGMAAAEALACGTPVITTNVTGISNIIADDHPNLITSANNPLLLAQKINELCCNQKLRDHLKMESTQFAQNLQWNNISSKIESVYDQVSS